MKFDKVVSLGSPCLRCTPCT